MELYKDELKLLEEMVHKLERNVPRNDRNDDEFNFSCKIEFILKLLVSFFLSQRFFHSTSSHECSY